MKDNSHNELEVTMPVATIDPTTQPTEMAALSQPQPTKLEDPFLVTFDDSFDAEDPRSDSLILVQRRMSHTKPDAGPRGKNGQSPMSSPPPVSTGSW